MTLITVLFVLFVNNDRCLKVESDWVTAKDVAPEIPQYASVAPDVRLLRTPSPGARRFVTIRSLPTVDETHQLPLALCVERRTQRLTRERFAEAVRASLLVSGQPDVAFEVVDYDISMLPSGSLEFLTKTLPPPILGHADDTLLWHGRIFYSEARSLPVWVRVRLWAEGNVCVLARDVQRGAELKIEDCKISKTRYQPFGPPPLREPAALERTTAVRGLRADEPLYSTLLTRKPDVEAGQQVELRVQNGGTELRFQAKAVNSGSRGDPIIVTNPSNGKRLKGQVSGRGSVEVRLK
jgi:flagella basal body P-ring formation protein FlgA